MTDVSPTTTLARFASELTYQDIPQDVVGHVKMCLLDSLACGLFGSTLRWTQILLRTLSTCEAQGPSQIIGAPERQLPSTAALVNGAAIHSFELDDLHPLSIVHPGSVAIPAVLALADQAGGIHGKAVITAIVAGYEVVARVGMALGTAHLLKGWHPTGTHGTIGAAAAAGSVLSLPTVAMANALGMAASQSSGLMSAQYGSMVKRFHAGRASQSGLYSAILVQQGYIGIPNVFEAPYGGYGPTFSPNYDPNLLTQGLGQTWETLNVGFKPYSTNGSCHPTIDALLELRRDHGIELADVRNVTIRVSSATKEHVGWRYRPDTVTTAQMNLPFIVAVVLADGDAFVEQFTGDRIKDKTLVEFTKRVTVEVSPSIDEMGDSGRHYTELILRLHDDRVFEVVKEYAKGSARSPLTSSEIVEKVDKLLTSFPSESAQRFKTIVANLEDCENSTDLTGALAM